MSVAAHTRVSSLSQYPDCQKAKISKRLAENGHEPRAIIWFEDKETESTLNRKGWSDDAEDATTLICSALWLPLPGII